jgi:hypothetical protein
LRDEPPSKCCVSAQQFCSAAMASKSTESASTTVATEPDGSCEGVGRTKSAVTFLRPGRCNICTLNSEKFRDESQMALLSRRNRGRNARQSGHKGFLVCHNSQLKSAAFTKMAKMPDRCMCSQQFMIKCGITRLCVGQFSEKETKWSPMVPRFLLFNSANMSIGGVSGKKVQLVVQDVGGAPLWPGGALNSGKPPVLWWSTPMFWAPLSGD